MISANMVDVQNVVGTGLSLSEIVGTKGITTDQGMICDGAKKTCCTCKQCRQEVSGSCCYHKMGSRRADGYIQFLLPIEEAKYLTYEGKSGKARRTAIQQKLRPTLQKMINQGFTLRDSRNTKRNKFIFQFMGGDLDVTAFEVTRGRRLIRAKPLGPSGPAIVFIGDALEALHPATGAGLKKGIGDIQSNMDIISLFGEDRERCVQFLNSRYSAGSKINVCPCGIL